MISDVAPRKKAQPRGSWAWRLQRLQERLGLPSADMAERFGVSIHTFNAWLYGVRQPAGPSQKLIELIERQK